MPSPHRPTSAVQRIDHVNIVVRDLQRMVRFYQDALDLVVTKQVTIRGSWIDQTVGLREVEGHVVYLDLPQGPRLELIQYVNPPAADPAGLDIANTPGLRHLAFWTDDIDAAVARLQHHGIAFLSAIQTVPDTQVQYAGGIRKRLVYFRDPEGNLLELCEYK